MRKAASNVVAWQIPIAVRDLDGEGNVFGNHLPGSRPTCVDLRVERANIDISSPKLMPSASAAEVEFTTRWIFLDTQPRRLARDGPSKVVRSAMRVAYPSWESPFGCPANDASVTLTNTTLSKSSGGKPSGSSCPGRASLRF